MAPILKMFDHLTWIEKSYQEMIKDCIFLTNLSHMYRFKQIILVKTHIKMSSLLTFGTLSSCCIFPKNLMVL